TGNFDLGALELGPAAVVRGIVVDRSGRPVEAAAVTWADTGQDLGEWLGSAILDEDLDLFAYGTNGVSRTAADGRFELPHVIGGAGAVVAYHREHPSARSEVVHARAGGEPVEVRI